MIRITVLAGLLMISCILILPPGFLHSAELDGGAKVKLKGSYVKSLSKRITVREIESAGIEEVEIYDPFEKNKVKYAGIWLDKFVKQFGEEGVNEVTFQAIDDYEISFHPQDWTHNRIMVVTKTNGKYTDFEQKGPLRIIYADFDRKKHNSKEIMPKWIWMITAINFK